MNRSGVLFTIALASFWSGNAAPAVRTPQGRIFLGRNTPCVFTPGGGLSAPLSSSIPADVNVARTPAEATVENIQCDFDLYSWQTFIALNWPAGARGDADTSRRIGDSASGDNATVFESWKPVTQIFPSDGQPPAPWDATTNAAARTLNSIVKGETAQAFDSGPLIDRNGEYVRFETLVNRAMFDYIVQQKLYGRDGQDALRSNVVFPCGRSKRNADGSPVVVDGRPVPEIVGAIVVKAAWKVLTPAEISGGRFHTVAIRVCARDRKALELPMQQASEAVSQADSGADRCAVRIMGLVGMHIVHKSEGAPQWAWATFEHVDNAPTAGHEKDAQSWSFYSKGHDDLPVNVPPPRPWTPQLPVADPAGQTQLVRTTPISVAVRQLNADFHDKLRAVNPRSVWQYYDLVSTQWPTRLAVAPADSAVRCDSRSLSPADPLGGPAPVFLANTTLESYIQGTTPNTSSSCMDCHGNATTTNGRFSDFTYILDRAKGGK